MDWRKPGSKRWRWVGLAVVVLAATALGFYRARAYAPLVANGERMEGFCEGLRKDMTRAELKAVVDTQGYRSSDQSDKQGPFLRIDDDGSGGHYHCEVRFKPDGSLGVVSFTAEAKD